MEIIPTISCGEDRNYIDHLTSGLFVASSFAGSVLNPHTCITSIPEPCIPEAMTSRAADWGGYRVVTAWKGEAPYTVEQYVNWLCTWHPQWAATWDYPCGDPLAQSDSNVVQDRQNRTTANAWRFWCDYRDIDWLCWVPTVQGWHLDDYTRHAEDMAPLIRQMYQYYQGRDGASTAFRVGIGSLVKRKPKAVRAIINTVASVLPDVQFHAWGMNYSMVKDSEAFHERLRSGDTSSFNGRFGKNIERDKGRSEPQRKIVFQEKLPAYLERIEKHLARPMQHQSLFDVMMLETNQDEEDIA